MTVTCNHTENPADQLQNTSKPKVAMVQGHARLHYAVPIALQRQNMLECMFVDWYGGPGSIPGILSKTLGLFSKRLGKRMSGRFCAEIESKYIRKNLLLRPKYECLPAAISGFDPATPKWSQKAAGNWIAKLGFDQADILHGFIRNIWPELYKIAREDGLLTTGEQIIAPAVIEKSEADIQSERYPGWGAPTLNYDLDKVIELESQTWSKLDHITCPSPYVKDGLLKQGIDESQISVAPYPIDPSQYSPADRSKQDGPITIGFVGKVSLRKGVPYFFEVAKRFNPKDVKFVMIGPLSIDHEIAQKEKGNVELVGSVPRTTVAEWLDKFDAILFPSTCEGSAGALMEAMAMGLPIITSPNSGTIIEHGKHGYLADYDDIDTFEKHITAIANDKELRLQLGRNAREYVETFNLDCYGQSLANTMTRLFNEHDTTEGEFE